MTRIHARKALLPDGWQSDVEIEVDAGRIAAVRHGAAASAGAERAGVVLPGLTNAHSHAFQRALSGHTEHRGSDHLDDSDNFWTWRECMYRLACRLDAATLTAIARQAYTEMLASGYTAVAEFHYLHSEPGRAPGEAMFDALRQAAADSGIRLTYVPILYQRGGFDDAPLSEEQRRFTLPLDAFLEHYRRCRERAGENVVVGIGAHSLRAVPERSLAALAETARADCVPMHIHVAEQRREVEQCLAVHHRRPLRWLLENHDLDERWCLVHATHADPEEVAEVAASGAVICLCPSTEANLGDGLFPLAAYLGHGGRIAIGSDSHISINPFEELRWLEYGQRLAGEKRNVAAIGARHTGRALYERVVAGGAQAGGTDTAGIAPGRCADLLLFDDGDPMLVGHRGDSLLDALVFSGYALPLERVMVNGEWRVADGRHVNRAAARDAFARAIERLDTADDPA